MEYRNKLLEIFEPYLNVSIKRLTKELYDKDRKLVILPGTVPKYLEEDLNVLLKKNEYEIPLINEDNMCYFLYRVICEYGALKMGLKPFYEKEAFEKYFARTCGGDPEDTAFKYYCNCFDTGLISDKEKRKIPVVYILTALGYLGLCLDIRQLGINPPYFKGTAYKALKRQTIEILDEHFYLYDSIPIYSPLMDVIFDRKIMRHHLTVEDYLGELRKFNFGLEIRIGGKLFKEFKNMYIEDHLKIIININKIMVYQVRSNKYPIDGIQKALSDVLVNETGTVFTLIRFPDMKKNSPSQMTLEPYLELMNFLGVSIHPIQPRIEYKVIKKKVDKMQSIWGKKENGKQ